MKFRMVLLAAAVAISSLGLIGCGDDSTTSLTPDTTPPLAPVILGARGNDSAVAVWWNDNTEPDLNGYNVYIEEHGVLVRINQQPIKGTYLVYNKNSEGIHSVRVTAVDFTGNESAAASRGVSYANGDIDGIDNPGDKLIDGF